jgi:hypothetical protein
MSRGCYRCTHYFWLLCVLEGIQGKEVGGWVGLAEMDLVTGGKHKLAKAPGSQLEFMAENSSLFLLIRLR